MQTLSREFAGKLYKLMPEILRGCENWYIKFSKNKWLRLNVCDGQNLLIGKENFIPAPTIEDILNKDFLNAFYLLIKDKLKLESPLDSSASIYNEFVDRVYYSFLDGKLEEYLMELLTEDN